MKKRHLIGSYKPPCLAGKMTTYCHILLTIVRHRLSSSSSFILFQALGP